MDEGKGERNREKLGAGRKREEMALPRLCETSTKRDLRDLAVFGFTRASSWRGSAERERETQIDNEKEKERVESRTGIMV